MYEIQLGSTDQTIYVHLKSSTTGLGQTGLVYNSAGAACRYTRSRAAATSVTLATLASATAAHSDGGFIEVDATNARGLYRLDLPDAVVASGSTFAVVTIQFTGVIETAVLVRLPAYNPYDAVRLGLTALPNVVAGGNGGLPTVDGSNGVTVGSASLTTIADGLLTRDLSAVTGEASRSVLNAFRFLRNRWAISGSTMTVYEEDDTTAAWTSTLTTSGAANPVVESNPS